MVLHLVIFALWGCSNLILHGRNSNYCPRWFGWGLSQRLFIPLRVIYSAPSHCFMPSQPPHFLPTLSLGRWRRDGKMRSDGLRWRHLWESWTCCGLAEVRKLREFCSLTFLLPSTGLNFIYSMQASPGSFIYRPHPFIHLQTTTPTSTVTAQLPPHNIFLSSLSGPYPMICTLSQDRHPSDPTPPPPSTIKEDKSKWLPDCHNFFTSLVVV